MRILVFLVLFMPLAASAQFDPAGGEEGSLAIHRDNASISYWGDSVSFIRGLKQINDSSQGYVTVGRGHDALGKADGLTLSLGDGGMITYYFNRSIRNIKGPDFVVFENGFEWPGGHFLELAFVEVSSNGKDFVRFPAYSRADTTKQIENLAFMRSEWYKNLAGKHQAPYGTPFDLEELKDSTILDITAVTHVRLIDVVGCLNDTFATRDIEGNKINDPWPTNFPPGGFDIDAIGVLQWPLSIEPLLAGKSMVWPNPIVTGGMLHVNVACKSLILSDLSGKIIRTQTNDSNIDLSGVVPGIYYVTGATERGTLTEKLCVTR